MTGALWVIVIRAVIMQGDGSCGVSYKVRMLLETTVSASGPGVNRECNCKLCAHYSNDDIYFEFMHETAFKV